MKTLCHPTMTRRGVTLLEVLIVIATVVLLVSLVIPIWGAARQHAQRINCVSNLKQISVGFRLWANDNNDKFPWELTPEQGGARNEPLPTLAARSFGLTSNELNTPKLLVCPSDRQRVRATNWVIGNANVSYFVGVGASMSNAAAILTGDRNLLGNGQRQAPGRHNLARFKQLSFDADLHNRVGNLGLADGTVQETTDAGLNHQVQAAIAVGETNVLIATP